MATYFDLVRVATDHHGQGLTTLAGRATFKVYAEGGDVHVVPTSTARRPNLRPQTSTCLSDTAKRSMTPADYQDITFNSVYVLRLIELIKSGR